jgi:hypothetical protein
MTKLNNSKLTNSAIFYNRGISPSAKNFGLIASLNYSMLRQVLIYNRKNGRPGYLLF